MELSVVAVEKPEMASVILGQSHFIKTVEDIHEAMVNAVPGIKFGVAFCEASGDRLVRVSGDFHFSPAAVGAARAKLEAFLSGRADGATASELRDVLGLSRKYAIPILEYFDAQGVTKREGDLRALRRRAEDG